MMKRTILTILVAAFVMTLAACSSNPVGHDFDRQYENYDKKRVHVDTNYQRFDDAGEY